MNRSRIAAVIAAVAFALTTLTGCPVAGGDDDDDEGGEEEDYITYSLVR